MVCACVCVDFVRRLECEKHIEERRNKTHHSGLVIGALGEGPTV